MTTLIKGSNRIEGANPSNHIEGTNPSNRIEGMNPANPANRIEANRVEGVDKIAPFTENIELKYKSFDALSNNAVAKGLLKACYGITYIVTAESMTGGMIFSALADVPFLGGKLYGGFITYNIAAKRYMLDIQQNDVYIQEVAGSMAKSALCQVSNNIDGNNNANGNVNNNTIVAISTTGYSAPVGYDIIHKLGTLYIGVAIGNNTHIKTKVIYKDLCKDLIIESCALYIEHAHCNNGFVPEFVAAQARHELREQATIEAIKFAHNMVDEFALMQSQGVDNDISREKWESC